VACDSTPLLSSAPVLEQGSSTGAVGALVHTRSIGAFVIGALLQCCTRVCPALVRVCLAWQMPMHAVSSCIIMYRHRRCRYTAHAS